VVPGNSETRNGKLSDFYSSLYVVKVRWVRDKRNACKDLVGKP
jgi:uncharacterized protein Veg